MRKEDRVVFSKYPCPTDMRVQRIFKSYQYFRKNILRAIESSFRVRDDHHHKNIRPQTRVEVRKDHDGTYFPVLTKPIRLNPPDLDKIQVYELFFEFYRDQRTCLMHISSAWFDNSGSFQRPVYPINLEISLRVRLMYVTIALMERGELNKGRLTDLRSIWSTLLIARQLDYLKQILEKIPMDGLTAWSYFGIRDSDGRMTTAWWEYVRKIHPKPAKLPPGAFVSFSV